MKPKKKLKKLAERLQKETMQLMKEEIVKTIWDDEEDYLKKLEDEIKLNGSMKGRRI